MSHIKKLLALCAFKHLFLTANINLLGKTNITRKEE